MKLLLHLGTHRTGTTSLQHHLAGNRQRLLAQGIYYPNPKPFFGGSGAAHFTFAHLLASDPDNPAVQSFVEHIQRAGARGYTTILSSEPLYRHVVGGGAPDTFVRDDYWEQRERYLRLVRTKLSRFDIKPYISFRRQDTFIESWFSQTAANTRGSLEQFSQYRESRRVMMMYARQLATIVASLGKPDIFLYERSGDMVRDVSQAMGLSLPPAKVRHYVSLDSRLVLWAEQAEVIYGQSSWPRIQKVMVSDDARRLANGWPEGAGALWSPSEREIFLESFRDENERFGQMIGAAPPFPAVISAKDKASVCAELKEGLNRLLDAAPGEAHAEPPGPTSGEEDAT